MKKTLYIVMSMLLLSSCRWFDEPPAVGLMLSKHFNNKLYKKFDTAEYNLVFREHLDSLRSQFLNPRTLKAFYTGRNFEPAMVLKHFDNGGLDSLKQYIENSGSHGFDAGNFRYDDLAKAYALLHSNKFASIEEVYPAVAALELNAAEALVRYHNFVYFGVLNPGRILSKYQIKVARPDSLSIVKVLETKDIATLLAKIQPVSEDYKVFQKELKRLRGGVILKEFRPGVIRSDADAKLQDSSAKLKHSRAKLEYSSVKRPDFGVKHPDSGANAALIKSLLVNMERLRWKLPERGEEYIQVNVPDYTLTWFDGKDTLSYMKVCVGGRREEGFEEKVKLYLKSGKLDDKPKNHQTPMLSGKLNSIQVNPIWNIPVSIARSEIYYMARKDRYYLSNNNIRVYYKNKLIADPDTIQWHKYKREKLPFKFKQGSGEGNALGKFKFIFDASSSIYLHDTNNKTAFRLANRAISHGCVRVERPLEFAEKLVKDKYQYDQLRMEVNLPPIDTTRMAAYQRKLAKKADTVNLFTLKPSWFAVKKPVPLVINYITAWVERGMIQYRPDVYGHDEVIWKSLKKFM